jgi:ATP-binding cassette subfamily B protein
MKNIFRIITLSKPLHPLALLISVLIVISASLQLVAAVLSKFIVDQIVAKVQGKGGDLQTLILLIIAAFAMSILGLIITVISNRLGDHFAGKLQKFLTEKFYDKVLTLPQSYFDSEMSGKIINQLNRGIVAIRGFLNSATNFILPTIVQSIFTLGVLAYYNLPIALFTFLLFPLYLLLSYYSTVKWGREEVKKNAIEDKMRGRMHEVIGNISLVKGFTNERKEYNFITNNLSASNDIYAKQSKTYHLFDFFRGLSLNIILFAINILVFHTTFQGALTIGEMVLILQLFNQARTPLFAMSFILTQVQTAESGSKEYFEILGLKSTENYRKKVSPEKIKDPTLTFEKVSFHYERSKAVLNNISFHINNGESVALVGHSGVGKSTIINLILKFYEPTSGMLKLNAKSYEKLDYHVIRQNIALVFQENELFSSTIRENVAYGNEKTTEKEIISALKMANAWSFVTKLPQGIDSEVGERGVRLSGGQKQRIQIARAILKKAPILILDEATSSLDAKSEKEVQNALEKLMKGKLTVIIAHRFSTIQNVDKIIVIDNGTIAAMGNPKELANQPGIYADLLNYQIQGNQKLLASFDLQ